MAEHSTGHRFSALDADAALRTIVEGTAQETGEKFYFALVENLARALQTAGAWVTELDSQAQRLRALAFWFDGEWIEGYEYALSGTPCEPVITSGKLVHIPEHVAGLFPHDPDLAAYHAVSYMGAPLTDSRGEVLGNLAVMDTKPLPREPRLLALFNIFAARAAAEHQRLRAEREVREREEQLSRLVDCAMDAILELDQDGNITLINRAAEQAFGRRAQEMIGREFNQFLAAASREKFAQLLEGLASLPRERKSLWVPGGLTALGAGGSFPAEATLSTSELQRRKFYTVILRNLNERQEAEQRIRQLTAAATYLRQEIQEIYHFDEIVGESAALRRVLEDIHQVAAADATVLIQGETGTGMELVARAIHQASRRRDQPLIKVNCAVLPAPLIESELFGHERGAFTGATLRRPGRFALADKGTIFLDEIGELPWDLQAKLLRVLQEGEFEAVGSSKTQRVDVRVVAATNRDLRQAIEQRQFREDLFYRLNVFPIRLPPLRERGADIALLATAFLQRFAKKMGRPIEPLTEACVRRLQAHSWPGNVRELENVIELAVITARDGRLNLDRALPQTAAANDPPRSSKPLEQRILTAAELVALERRNIEAALEACGGQIAGGSGAARRLGMKPTTLSSRMKALGIRRTDAKRSDSASSQAAKT